MTFDIEKMKADGVEERLIDWIQMDTVSKLSLVARRLEQDALFKQFLQEYEADIDKYAVSAGLLSKADREWIADKNNPYKNPDCEHTDLGTLIYCGNASNKAIVSEGGTCDEGVQDGWCDAANWWMKMGEPTTCNGYVGVFDGVVIPGITVSENSVEFGDYLSLVRDVDTETGDSEIRVSTLNGASHYAIYFCADCNQNHYYQTLGILYYCGGLQNGIILNTDGTFDKGAVITDEQAWTAAVSEAAMGGGTMYLVSNGDTVTATATSENSVAFGNVGLSREVNAETGDSFITISNAPSHYAIYFKMGEI